MDFDSDQSLKEWAKDKPLSILQLDPADRAVLRIAGKFRTFKVFFNYLTADDDCTGLDDVSELAMMGCVIYNVG